MFGPSTFAELIEDTYRMASATYLDLSDLDAIDLAACDGKAPEIYLGARDFTRSRESATHVIVPNTEWGDYVGSLVERSNYVALLESWPQYVIDVNYGHGSHAVAVPLELDIEDDDSYFVGELVAVWDGEILDDGAYSEIEQTLERESWESYGADDFVREIQRAAEYLPDSVREEIDGYLDETDNSQLWELVLDVAQAGNHCIHFVAEGANGGGYWEELDDMTQEVIAAILRRLDAADVEVAPSVDGQLRLV